MGFDPLSWLIGKGANRLLNAVFSPTLSRALEKATRKWVETVPAEVAPDEHALHALFAAVGEGELRQPTPALARIQCATQDFGVPSLADWEQAIRERRELLLRQGADSPFFTAEAAIVEPYIVSLARVLHRTLLDDPQFANRQAIHDHRDIVEHVQTLGADVAFLRSFIENLRGAKEQTRVWRELPNVVLPIVPRMQHGTAYWWADAVAVAMHQAFEAKNYVAFPGLLHFEEGDKVDGVRLYTNQALFCTRLRQALQGRILSGIQGEYAPLEALKGWHIDLNVPKDPLIQPCELVFDRPGNSIRMAPVAAVEERTIWEGMSLLDAFRLLGALVPNRARFNSVEIKHWSIAPLKMLSDAVTHGIYPDRFRINANVPEEWDFAPTPALD